MSRPKSYITPRGTPNPSRSKITSSNRYPKNGGTRPIDGRGKLGEPYTPDKDREAEEYNGKITYAPDGRPIMPPRPFHMYIPIVRQGYEDLLAQWQTEYDRWMLEQARKYDSPESQRGRMEDAGYNPNLFYDQGQNHAAGTAEASRPENLVGQDVSNIINSVMAIATGLTNIRKVKADTLSSLKDVGLKDLDLQLETFLLGYKKAIQGPNASSKSVAEAESAWQTAEYKTYETALAKAGMYRQDPIQWRMLYQVLTETGLNPVDMVSGIISNMKENIKSRNLEIGERYNKDERPYTSKEVE